MIQKVLITLKSIQWHEKECDETELITEGTLQELSDKLPDNGFKICYDESAITGFEGSQTVVTCYGDRIATMNREGANRSEYASDFIIEKDKKHHCHYDTPYGSFMLGVYTHEIKNTLDINTGGEIYLKYTIDINSSYLSDNEVFLDIKVIE